MFSGLSQSITQLHGIIHPESILSYKNSYVIPANEEILVDSMFTDDVFVCVTYTGNRFYRIPQGDVKDATIKIKRNTILLPSNCTVYQPRIGMSRESLILALGEPDNLEFEDMIEYLKYNKRNFTFRIENGLVSEILSDDFKLAKDTTLNCTHFKDNYYKVIVDSVEGYVFCLDVAEINYTDEKVINGWMSISFIKNIETVETVETVEAKSMETSIIIDVLYRHIPTEMREILKQFIFINA